MTLLNETKKMARIPANASIRTLARLARRNDGIGAQARERLKRLTPAKIGPALAALRAGLAKGKAVSPTSVPGLKRATKRSIQIAMAQAAKDAEKNKSKKNEKRRRKYGEDRVRKQTAAEKDAEIAKIKKELEARTAADSTRTHPVFTPARAAGETKKRREGAHIRMAPRPAAAEKPSSTLTTIKKVMTKPIDTTSTPHTPPRQEHGYHDMAAAIYPPKPAHVPTHVKRQQSLDVLKRQQARDDEIERKESPVERGARKDAEKEWDKALKEKKPKKWPWGPAILGAGGAAAGAALGGVPGAIAGGLTGLAASKFRPRQTGRSGGLGGARKNPDGSWSISPNKK